ncbi:MAG: hypothetical protein ACRDNS_03905, partial [Trebonia sp.]
RLAGESGETPSWDVPGFTDVRAAARSGVEHLRNCPWLAHRDEVRGFVYDTVTTRLSEVTQRNA